MGRASVLVRRRGASGRAFPRRAWEREVNAFAAFDLDDGSGRLIEHAVIDQDLPQ